MSVVFKSMPMETEQQANGNLIFKISTNIPDRDSDILEPMGVKLENYRNNPVVLFAHDYSSLPVGRSLWEKVYSDYIESEVEFAPTAFAQDCKKLCEAGFLNAASVGFVGLEHEPIKDSNWGKRYKSWELLEWSVVPVPSNFGSLIQNAKAKGLNLDAIEKELQDLKIKNVITKPGWDETETSFRFRVRDPDLFQDGSFRTVPIKKDKPRVNSIMGRLKDETTLTVQSVIFPKEDDWDLAGAKAWLKEHEELTKEIEAEEKTGVSDAEIKDMFENEIKVGATISAKTKDIIEGCISNLQKEIEKLNNIIGNISEEEEKTELEVPVKIEMSDEIKKEFENIRSEMSLLSKKNNEDEINLDSIELSKAEKDAEQDELDIEPEGIKEMIKQIIENELKGGN